MDGGINGKLHVVGDRVLISPEEGEAVALDKLKRITA